MVRFRLNPGEIVAYVFQSGALLRNRNGPRVWRGKRCLPICIGAGRYEWNTA